MNRYRSLSLWKRALEELQSDLEGIELGDGTNIDLLRNLIDATEKKKEELDKNRWSYTNRKGEKVYITDSLLRQLNKFATIGDIAIQHDPQVVALAWAGFRFILNVSYKDNHRYNTMLTLQRLRWQTWRTFRRYSKA
jgi:hypothetical protein